jgi:hypothetical protein
LIELFFDPKPGRPKINPTFLVGQINPTNLVGLIKKRFSTSGRFFLTSIRSLDQFLVNQASFPQKEALEKKFFRPTDSDRGRDRLLFFDARLCLLIIYLLFFLAFFLHFFPNYFVLAFL